MTVYNNTGVDFQEIEWDVKFLIIADAYRSFRECVGGELDKINYERLRELSIVILPPKEGGGMEALTFVPYIFIPANHFDVMTIRHELMHPYLYYTGRYLLGDYFHRSSLFKRCG